MSTVTVDGHTVVQSVSVGIQGPPGALGGANATDATLVSWVAGEAYQPLAVTLDSDQVPSTATVRWPDGSTGAFTRTAKSDAWLAVDAYQVTHTLSGKTIVQAAVTRDADGNVTTKPALTVEET